MLRPLAIAASVVLAGAAALGDQPPDRRLSPDGPDLGGSWTFTDGAEYPGARGGLHADGDGVLHLAYDFSDGGNYVGAYCELDPPAEGGVVSLRIRKPPHTQLTIRATDDAGQSFQKPLFYEHGDWQQAEFDFHGWEFHYGGPNDGLLRPPVRRFALLVERCIPAGEVSLADVALHEKPESPSAEPGRADYAVARFRDEEGFSVSGGTLAGGRWEVDLGRTTSSSLRHSLALFGRPEELSLSVADGPAGAALSITLGSHFQSFRRELGRLTGGPQTLSVPPPPDGWTHGGAEEGGVSHPLRLLEVRLDRGDAAAGPACVGLGELRCKTRLDPGGSIVALGRLVDAGMEGETRRLTLECDAWNLAPGGTEATAELALVNWEGDVLQDLEAPWTLEGGGTRNRRSWKLEAPAESRFAEVRIRLVGADGRRTSATSCWAAPMDDPGSPGLDPSSPWGMGVYLYRYPANPEGRALMERAAAMAQAAGVKWSREEFSWSQIERAPGQYDWERYDALVDAAQRHGISIYGLLAYWSSHTKPYTEEGIDDFCRWARAVVARYKDRIHYWEIYNEPNIFFWSGPRELYPELVKRCHAAIKEEDPGATVLAVSTAGIDMGFIRQCVEADAPFDVLTVHPYRSRLAEDGLVSELRAASELAGGVPVWITEMGWPTHAEGRTEREQAILLARSYLAAVESGVCPNVSWYNFRCDGWDPFYNEHNFGVLRHDLTPKPAYRALASVCRNLAPGTSRRLPAPEGVRAVATEDAAAVWSPAGGRSVTVKVGSPDSRALNLMGEEVEAAREGDALTVDLLPGAPVFLRGGPFEVIESAVAPSRERGVLRF